MTCGIRMFRTKIGPIMLPSWLYAFIASHLRWEGKQAVKSKARAIMCCKESKIIAPPKAWNNIPKGVPLPKGESNSDVIFCTLTAYIFLFVCVWPLLCLSFCFFNFLLQPSGSAPSRAFYTTDWFSPIVRCLCHATTKTTHNFSVSTLWLVTIDYKARLFFCERYYYFYLFPRQS